MRGGTRREWRNTHEQQHGGRRDTEAHAEGAVDELSKSARQREDDKDPHDDLPRVVRSAPNLPECSELNTHHLQYIAAPRAGKHRPWSVSARRWILPRWVFGTS